MDVTRKPTANRAGQVARVFQDPLAGSCGALTIEENLALAAARGKTRGLLPALGGGRRAFFQERIASLNLGLETASRTVWTFSPVASVRRYHW